MMHGPINIKFWDSFFSNIEACFSVTFSTNAIIIFQAKIVMYLNHSRQA